MIKVIAFVCLLPLLAVANDGGTTCNSDPRFPWADQECTNQSVYNYGTDLCQRSKCQKCGLFFYNGTAVRYEESTCEYDFKLRDDERKKKQEDQAIRQKYGK